MSKERVQSCPALEVYEWDSARGWAKRTFDLHNSLSPDSDANGGLVSAKSQVCFVSARANKIRECESCRAYFTDNLLMPKSWWSDSSRMANGYFSCRVTKNYIDTWVYFEIKQLEEGAKAKYRWYKLNLYIRWNKSTKQTIMLAFDVPDDLAPTLLPDPNPRSLHLPFWFYPHLLSEVARLEESAVWAIRDRVRDIEKEATPGGRPDPDYRHMHDVARHAHHVSEGLDVAAQTIQRILAQHRDLMQRGPLDEDDDELQDLHSQLQFFESFISSLRYRSAANEKRMANEIQLAFNTVAQHDARTSVKIGLATQSDSMTMKSIAVVTLTFLPPTFISAIFSMSFFNFSPESGWSISREFWLYWVFAVPTTVVVLLWYHRQRSFNPTIVAPEKQSIQLFV
ncbi:hypothetical protein F4802DRAFT_368308 [Xylaria palmicola]|nr:hypothetical protein F4802DRAFT_368308 [Xylaria palmicola]